jgi:hypothetical protein
MFGFLVGTVCLVGLLGVVRAGRVRGRHRGSCGHGGHHGKHRTRSARRRGFSRAFAEIFKRRLDVDEEQEDIVDHAFKDLFSAAGALKEALANSREDIASAFAGDSVDDASLDVVFAHQDEEVKDGRRKVVSALKQIHAVLTPEQREEASAWLAGEFQGGW